MGELKDPPGPLDVLLPLRGRGLRADPEHVVEVGEEVLVVRVVQRVGGPVQERGPGRDAVHLGQHAQALPPQLPVLLGVLQGGVELRRRHAAEPAAHRAALGQLDGRRGVHDLVGPVLAELADAAVDHPLPPGAQPRIARDGPGPLLAAVLDLLVDEVPVAQHGRRDLRGPARPDQARRLQGRLAVHEGYHLGRGQFDPQGSQRRLRVAGECLLVLRVHRPALQEALHVRHVPDVLGRHIGQVAEQAVVRR